MWNFNILVCLTVTIIRAAEIEVVYEIPQGKIMGHKTTTAFNGVTYYSFKGIPYSKPKVGVQKFDVSYFNFLLVSTLFFTNFTTNAN